MTDGWSNGKPGQLLGFDKGGNRVFIDPHASAAQQVLLARQHLLLSALRSARDALETLRRCHGVEARTACYPALNLVREAIEACEPISEGARTGVFPSQA